MTTENPSSPKDKLENGPYDETDDSLHVIKALKLLVKDPDDVPELIRDVPLRSSLHPTIPAEKHPIESECNVPFRLRPPIGFIDDGVFLVYEATNGGTLYLQYSHHTPENAIAFCAPDEKHPFPEYKFTTHGGKWELIHGLIGGEHHHRRYLIGWCQFWQVAKSCHGLVKQVFHPYEALTLDACRFLQVVTRCHGELHRVVRLKSLHIDAYGFVKGRVVPLDMEHHWVNAGVLEAVAVVPHSNDRFQGVHALPAIAFLEHGNIEGASMQLHE